MITATQEPRAKVFTISPGVFEAPKSPTPSILMIAPAPIEGVKKLISYPFIL